MHTILSYFKDTYKFQEQATLIGSNKDENGYFVMLDNTIFYPQGGGQPSDSGQIVVGNTVIPIQKVKCSGGDIRHYTDKDYSMFIGQMAQCTIDREKRLLNARLHSGGHLISNVVEELYPNWIGIKGHHYPNLSYVEFSAKTQGADNISLELINQELESQIAKNSILEIEEVSGKELPLICPNMTSSHFPDNQPIRIMRIGNYPFSPCGGTHVKSLGELKGLEISKCKIKNTSLKINYHINEVPVFFSSGWRPCHHT